jgi:hypothetical protein
MPEFVPNWVEPVKSSVVTSGVVAPPVSGIDMLNGSVVAVVSTRPSRPNVMRPTVPVPTCVPSFVA